MAAVAAVKPIQERKRELLLESDINRQVLQLEIASLQQRLGQIKLGLFHSRWTYLAPLAALLLTWKFRRLRPLLQSSFGLILLRKLWETLAAQGKLPK